MSDDLWRHHHIEEETAAQAYRERRQRWVQSIQSAPVMDLQTIKVSAASIRRVGHEIVTQQVHDWREMEHLAMDFLCAAIHAGVCSGIEWLEWRTRLAGQPHIGNAVEFLNHYAPVAYRYPPPTSAGSFHQQAAAIMHTMASVIERIAGEIERTTQTPPTPHAAPTQSVAEEDHLAEILVALLELKAFDQRTRKSTPTIARKAIGPNADPACLKRYISILKKRGEIGTKGGRTGGAWLTERGQAAASKINGNK